MNELDQRMREIFGRLFRTDPTGLDDSSRRGELEGWDSLAHLDLVAELEGQFGVAITPELALEIETMGDAKRVLGQLLGDA